MVVLALVLCYAQEASKEGRGVLLCQATQVTVTKARACVAKQDPDNASL